MLIDTYNLSPEGEGGAAGSSSSGTNPNGDATGTTDNNADKTTSKGSNQSETIKIPYKGKILDLSPAEAMGLLQEAVANKLEERNKPVTPTSGDDDEVDPQEQKINELHATVEQMKQNWKNEQVASHRRQIETTLKSLAKEFDLTKGDPEIANTINDMVYVELMKNSEADIEEVYKKKVKWIGDKFQKSKKEYVEEKLKDRTKTQAPTSSGGSSPGTKEQEKPKGNDLMNRGTLRRVMDKLSQNKKSQYQ